MNDNNMIIVILLGAAGVIFAVGLLFAIAAGIFLWPKLRLLWKLIQQLPGLEPFLRNGATGLRTASQLIANTGRVSCAAGQELDAAATTIGSFQAPTLDIQRTSLGGALRSIGLMAGPANPLDAMEVITGVGAGPSVSIFGANNPLHAASALFGTSAGVLGYTCTATPVDFNAQLPDPPPFPSVAGGLNDAATGLDLMADIVHVIQS
jgi:hypothetical protein